MFDQSKPDLGPLSFQDQLLVSWITGKMVLQNRPGNASWEIRGIEIHWLTDGSKGPQPGVIATVDREAQIIRGNPARIRGQALRVWKQIGRLAAAYDFQVIK